MSTLFLKLAIYWASYLAFLAVIVNCYFIFRSKKLIFRLLYGFSLLILLVFIWSRFIEPQLITVQTTRIQFGSSLRVALISDTHLGIYKDKYFLERVVETINNQPQLDMLLIAGDFTYEPDKQFLDDMFAPLGKVKIPIYAVLGNHDVEQPGPKLRTELNKALTKAKVRIIDNQILDQSDYKLVGLGDNWANEDQVDLLQQVQSENKVIVLTHNPDTTLKFPADKADLTLTGHTHCGQVRIPFVYPYFLPVKGSFDKGLTRVSTTQLFITCGTGEVGLPMRLFNPPVVDILELY